MRSDTSADSLVCVSTPGDTIEAQLLRAYLEDHGVFVHLQGEHHRSLLGMVGTFVDVRLLVPAAQAELARSLLERYANETPPEDPAEFRGPFRDEDDAGDEDDRADDWRRDAEIARRIRAARMTALLLPLGAGHLSAGAWARGLVLAAVAIGGVAAAVSRHPVFALLLPIAVAMDWICVARVVEARAQRQRADA
jgi:hypothetical protein